MRATVLLGTVLWGVLSGLADWNAFTANADERPVESEVSMERVHEAWRDRQQRIVRIACTWDGEEVFSRSPGELKVHPGDALPGSEPPGTVKDREALRFACHSELLLSGNKLRYVSDRPVLFGDLGKYLMVTRTAVCNDTVFQELTEQPSGFHYEGIVRNPDGEYIHVDEQVRPLFLFASPFFHDDKPLDGYTIEQRNALIDDSPCLVVRKASRSGLAKTMWLDPGADFCVKRIQYYQGSRLWRQTDITYTMDSHHGPIPSGWATVRYFDNGEFDGSFKATVSQCKINDEIEDTAFSLTFPAETVVSDQTGQSDSQTWYVVRHDGTNKVVHPSELRRGVKVKDVLRDDSSGVPFLWTSVLVLIGVMAVAWFMRYRHVQRT